MANLTAVAAKSASLSTTTADTITFSGTGDKIQVLNRDATTALTFTINSSGAPTTLMDEGFVVAQGIGQSLTVEARGRFVAPVVKIVGSGNAYTVQLLPRHK